MKKVTLILLGLTIGLMAEKPYLLSPKIIIEERALSNDIIYQDWCIDRQVWREYNTHNKGSLSQIMHSKDGITSTPLKCSLYEGWKENIERLNKVAVK